MITMGQAASAKFPLGRALDVFGGNRLENRIISVSYLVEIVRQVDSCQGRNNRAT